MNTHYDIKYKKRGIRMPKNIDNSLQNQIIAMSNTLAEKSTRFSVTQQKLFYVSLASLKSGKNSNNEVKINKQELIEYLGFENDTSKYTRLRYQFKKLAEKSWIEFGTDEEFSDGFLINKVRSTKYDYYVRFDEDLIPLLEELASNYVRLLEDDVTSFDSKFSMMLYQNIMKDKWKLTHPDYYGIPYSTRQLKMIFGLSKDDYVRKDGSFDRTNFERYTVNKAISEINEKSKCVKKLTVKKVKKGNRIAYYEFYYHYVDPSLVRRENDEKRQRENTIEAQREGKRIERNQQLTIQDYGTEYSDDVKNLEWWNM